MTQLPITPDRLFDRSWHMGRPFGHRTSMLRNIVMFLLLLVLAGVILLHWYLTDANRVKSMAEHYLGGAMHTRVTVGRASLSLFEGLQLDDVRVYLDKSADPEQILFTADSFHIDYDPRAMLRGDLKARQIVATKPHVRLIENLDTRTWNYQQLFMWEHRTQEKQSSEPSEPDLPEVVLRDAQVDYGEVSHGVMRPRGSVAIEGRMWPGADGQRYSFDLQSRGQAEGVGPVLSGSVWLGTGQVILHLRNFELGQDLRSMLPNQVRNWWESHQITGRVDIPNLHYTPAMRDRKAQFRVEAELNGVNITIDPREWHSAAENDANERLDKVLTILRGGPLKVENLLASVQEGLHPLPVSLAHTSGGLVFTDDGIEIQDITGRLEANAFRIAGHIAGYSPGAAGSLSISSLESENLYIPHSPAYLAALPGPVREVYNHIKPEGTAQAHVTITRKTAGGRPEVGGEIRIVKGNFTFDRFPYPLRDVKGVIELGRGEDGSERLLLKELRGKGIAGGPNANCNVTIDGFVGPLGPQSEVRIVVQAKGIVNEPALMAALPRDTQQGLATLDAPGKGQFPTFAADFVCIVHRPLGYNTVWDVKTDLEINHAAGALKAFPYPLEDVSATVRVRHGYLDIENAHMTRGKSSLRIDGRLDWMSPEDAARMAKGADATDQAVGPAGDHGGGEAAVHRENLAADQASDTAPMKDAPAHGAMTNEALAHEPPAHEAPTFRPNLTIQARNVLIDDTLIAALPADRGKWVRKLGMGGRLNIDGKVMPADEKGEDYRYDISMQLSEGTMWPVDGQSAVSGITGGIRLTPEKLTLSDMEGSRGDATISAAGWMRWGAKDPQLTLRARAKGLMLDESLRAMLPKSSAQTWDRIRPEGTVDMDFTYSGSMETLARRSQWGDVETGAVASIDEQSLPAEPAENAGYAVTVRPVKLAVTPSIFPLKLEEVTGTVVMTGNRIQLQQMQAKHGPSKVKLSGEVTLGERPVWDLSLSASELTMDESLRAALPETLKLLGERLKLSGEVSVDFPLLRWTAPKPTGFGPGIQVNAPGDAARGVASGGSSNGGVTAVGRGLNATQPADEPEGDLDFKGVVKFDHASMEVGVPLTEMVGQLSLEGQSREGVLNRLKGDFDVSTLKLSGRPASALHASISRDPAEPIVHIEKMRGKLADGELAGELSVAYPDNGPPRFQLSLVLRAANARQLMMSDDQKIQGELTASLALEGDVDAPATRRGRGEVKVSGKSMYQIPVVLGLLEITNLSLPINSPFKTAGVKYGVQGSLVTLEQIELKSDQVRMMGSGWLNYDTNKMHLVFTTDNPNWPNVPLIGDLINGAKNELLQIQVNGTIQKPQVGAKAMNTFQTTIDEVLGEKKK